MRRLAKVDGNQAELVKAFRAMGCSVLPLHTIGQGCPDLLVGIRGVNVLVEIKDGSAPKSARKLRPTQSKFHLGWRGPIEVAESTADVREIMRQYGAKIKSD